MGKGFFDRYKALPLDTGHMTAEELAFKHLDTDLTKPDFWQDTVDGLAVRVEHFEKLAASRVQYNRLLDLQSL